MPGKIVAAGLDRQRQVEKLHRPHRVEHRGVRSGEREEQVGRSDDPPRGDRVLAPHCDMPREADAIERHILDPRTIGPRGRDDMAQRSEEHTSELQSLMRTSYAVLCLKKTKETTYEQKSTMRRMYEGSRTTNRTEKTRTLITQ